MLQDLLKDKDLVTAVLKYHVISAAVEAGDLKKYQVLVVDVFCALC